MKSFINEKKQVVQFLDERFYKINEETYYPSITTVLDVYPKGFGFNQWLKDVGGNASDILERAGKLGSNVHNAIDNILQGIKISWQNEQGLANYSLQEWQMILRFKEFYDKFKPEIICNECQVISHELKRGGTIDIVAKLNGQIYLLDIKTGNGIYTTHELQVAAYAEMWNKNNPEQKINKTAILWLNALTRGEGKGGAIQGQGWQIKEFDRPYSEAFKIFLHVNEIWNEENPDPKPKNLQYPIEISLTDKI